MINIQKLSKIASYFTIIHHIKGRVRVRVNPKIKEQGNSISIKDIEQLSQKIDGIKKIKINKVVASVTIEYDNAIFPDHLWNDLVAGENLDKIAGIINIHAREVM